MGKSGKKRLRAVWLQLHKWIGLTLALLIIPICLTGSALVWHDWLDARLEPQRHASYGKPVLEPARYEQAAHTVTKQGSRISSLRYLEDNGPVMVTAVAPSPGSARPERTNIWINPVNGRVIDQASASAGPVRFMHNLHGSLMIPGWGRPIVGWVGLFMVISCLSGIWLWWPLRGSFRTGLRWMRRNTLNANLHYFTGFWVLPPLAMLSFTGAWISFPGFFGNFEARPSQGPSDRSRAIQALPLQSPSMDVGEAIAAARFEAPGRLVSISWPTDRKEEWELGFDVGGKVPAKVEVNDRTGEASLSAARERGETMTRKMRRWHDGTGMGPGWQIIIFLGGIIPALLSITGIIIWSRARAPRQRARDYRRLAGAAS